MYNSKNMWQPGVVHSMLVSINEKVALYWAQLQLRWVDTG